MYVHTYILYTFGSLVIWASNEDEGAEEWTAAKIEIVVQ